MIDDNAIVRHVARAIDGVISRAAHGPDAVGWNPDSKIKRLREVRSRTRSILGQLTDEQAAWSPQRGAWSIAEIADHVLLSEQMYWKHARRLLRQAAEGEGTTLEISLEELDVGLPSIPREVVPLLEFPFRIFHLFVPTAVRETLVRYPIVSATNPRIAQPRRGRTLTQLRRDIATSLEETEDFITTPMPVNVDELTIRHPIHGNNTFAQLFRFLIAHEQRHQEQMSRVRSHVGFPKRSRSV